MLWPRTEQQECHHLACVLADQRAGIVDPHLALDAAIGRETHRAVLTVFDQKWLVVAVDPQSVKNVWRDSSRFVHTSLHVLVNGETTQRQQIVVPTARHTPTLSSHAARGATMNRCSEFVIH